MNDDNFEIFRDNQLLRRRGYEGLVRTAKVKELARINYVLKKLGVENPDRFDKQRIAKILYYAALFDEADFRR